MTKPLLLCIVDDDDVYQFTVARTIQKEQIDCELQVFPNGARAIDFLSQHLADPTQLPDLIFLDISMPVMDGWLFMDEFVKIKPRLGKQIVIYMVSSSVDNKDLERARRISEISDYVVKPIEPTHLKEIFARFQSKP